MKSYNQNKKLRYGGISVALTAAFITLVIVFNVVFSAFAEKFRWYIDMTPEELYTVSDQCIDLLKDIDKEVKILFCSDPDTLNDTNTSRLVYNTALQLQKKLKNVKVETVNIIDNRSAVSKYKTTATTNIKTTDVIIESGSEFRQLALESFFTFNNQNVVWAYNAEAKFASTIIAVTRAEAPVCAVLTNHGEAVTDIHLLELITNAGYDYELIDLSKDEIPQDCRLMVCYNPTSDFLTKKDAGSDISEIDKLEAFLDGVNAFMLFVSPSTPVLPNLEEYMYEWGVEFGRYADENNRLSAGIVKDPSHSIDYANYNVVAEYVTGEGTLGTQVNQDLTNAGTAPKIIFPDAMPLRHSDSYDQNGYYSSNGITRQINDIFVTSADAFVEANQQTVQKADKYNKIPLLTITTQGRQVGNSTTTEYSYVMVSGSIDFAAGQQLTSNVYGNSESLYSMMRIMQKEVVYLDVGRKPFATTQIESLTASDAKTTTAMLAIIPAAIVFISGIAIIYVRRKRA